MELWERLESVRVATLGTLRPSGRPHLVPVVFAVVGERVVTAIDGKPKSGSWPQRLKNIEQNPLVSLLAHHYDEDWERLWWVRVDGVGTVTTDDPEALSGLRARYRQYATVELPGPVISIAVTGISGWPS